MSEEPVILTAAPGWCAPEKEGYGMWHTDDYIDRISADDEDYYALPCWMCGDLVEVSEPRFQVRNFRGELIIKGPSGYCRKCHTGIVPPTPDELREASEKLIRDLGPLGWWWWLDD